jgi:CTP synthase
VVKYIFVTGGVSSALGKGITAASLGRLLKARGLKVTLQKLDPYLNVDPGTMNPFEHGEVFVTDDGGETDLDLGHYERFIDENLHRGSSVSSGQIWSSVITKERRGDYLGKTVQVIPHITDEIKDRIHAVADADGELVDVVITEVGGTVGRHRGPAVPRGHPPAALRRRAGQHLLRPLRPGAVHRRVGRAQDQAGPALGPRAARRRYPARRAGPAQRPAPRRRAAAQGVDAVRRRARRGHLGDRPLVALRGPARHARGGARHGRRARLGLPDVTPDLAEWEALVQRVQSARDQVTVAIVGKYVDLPDAYLSVVESLRHGGLAHGVEVQLRWIASDDLSPGEGRTQDEADRRRTAARRRRRRPRPRRVRGPRGRGQDRRDPVGARSTRSRSSGCASACSRRSSSSPATSSACRTPTPRSSSPTAPIRSSTSCTTSVR